MSLDGGSGFDYRAARIGAAGALIATLVALVIIDAMSVEYAIEAMTLGTIAGAVLVLLGVEAASFFRNGKG